MKRKYEKNIFVYLIMFLAILLVFVETRINGKAQECKNAYEVFFEKRLYEGDFDYLDDVHYEYVYIDDDNIPELLLADGNFHVSRVALYYYNEEIKQVEFLASFSSFGQMRYIPKENKIISQYGNHGYYHEVYSKIEDGKIELLNVFLLDGSKEEHKYYGGFPVAQDFTGGYGKPNSAENIFETLPEVTEEYRISEEEYKSLKGEFDKGSVKITYDEMQKL